MCIELRPSHLTIDCTVMCYCFYVLLEYISLSLPRMPCLFLNPECLVTLYPECIVTLYPEFLVTLYPECLVTLYPECIVTRFSKVMIAHYSGRSTSETKTSLDLRLEGSLSLYFRKERGGFKSVTNTLTSVRIS